MGKIKVNKYSLDGQFICSYSNIQQAANDMHLNESTLRKPLKKRGSFKIKGYVFTTDKVSDVKTIINHKAKILLLDIETAPIKCYSWGVCKQNINPIQIIQDWFIISWSAKWLFDNEYMSDVLTPTEVIFSNDERIMKNLWDIMDEADIIITHNGRAFDIPKINSRFLLHGLNPPSPYMQIDTLEIARKNFGFTHNKLDYLAEQLGLTRKIETNFQLWIDCLNGNAQALSDMLTYNKQDVGTLEEVYVTLRPYITNHPNLALFIDSDGTHCPRCASDQLIHTGKLYSTIVNQFEVVQCKNCGAYGRGRYAVKTLNKTGLVNTAR